MTYPSKVDSWIGIVFALVPISLLLEAIVLRSLVVVVVAASILVLYASILVLYWLAVLPTNYEMGPSALTVRSGIIRSFIPYQEIRQVRASRSWLSAPALSLDRLEITYGSSRMTLISPRDRAAFLRDFSAHIPELRIDVLTNGVEG